MIRLSLALIPLNGQSGVFLFTPNLVPSLNGSFLVFSGKALRGCPFCHARTLPHVYGSHNVFLGKVYYALEASGDGATALVSGWQRKGEDFPAYRVPVIEGGLLRRESLDLFKAFVTYYHSSSGLLWEYAANTLLRSVQ